MMAEDNALLDENVTFSDSVNFTEIQLENLQKNSKSRIR